MGVLIIQLLQMKHEQKLLDNWHEKHVNEIFAEVDKYFKFYDSEPSVVRKFKYFKPYWDKELHEA